MRALVQRIQRASVRINGEIHAETGRGLLIFLGISQKDGFHEADYLVTKIPSLRIFEDESGKMNKSVSDIEGDIIIVSQFTLYADTSKGNRPSFTDAAPPERAKEIYDYFVDSLADIFSGSVKTGVFGADMKVSLINDGPVTVMLDTDV